MIPYSRQTIDEDDIEAVVEVLRSAWLTTGPKVSEFEELFAQFVGAKHAVVVNSGTAALHATMFAAGIGPDDEVIVPPITFAASANCVVYQGGTPIFSDVKTNTLLIDPEKVESNITSNTKAIIAVDYAGHPCDYDSLRKIAEEHHLIFVADACHALGAEYEGNKVGSLADMTVFSFHPVKHITTGEGGIITTDNANYANQMRTFRNHGITIDHHQRNKQGSWFYEIEELGYNFRITDFQCALGISQLLKLPKFLERRLKIAQHYKEAFASIKEISPLSVDHNVKHAFHLYVTKVDFKKLGIDRAILFTKLREKGIAINVHYIPVHLHPFYRKKYNVGLGLCPIAEAAYKQIISLPIFPTLNDDDVEKIIKSLIELISG